MLKFGEIRKLIEKIPDDAELGFYIKIHGTVITFSDDSELRDLAASFDLKPKADSGQARKDISEASFGYEEDIGGYDGDDPDILGY